MNDTPPGPDSHDNQPNTPGPGPGHDHESPAGGSGGSGPSWSSQTSPPPPPPGYAPMGPVGAVAPAAPASRMGGVITRVLTGLFASLLVISIILNFYLGIYFVSSMQGPQESTYLKGDVSNRIVVIPVNGLITGSTAKQIHDSLDALRENPPKAIILRVDSGGGGVSASDRIWHEMKQFKADLKIPIVASFGSMAASGGYYISMNCDYIYAEPTTITGSIGVIAEAFTVQDLLKKVGVTPEIVIATKATKKDSLSPFRAWTDKDRGELRGILDNAYVRFVNIVAEGRSKHLTHEQVETLATGEPFTATQAIKNNLVDAEGYMDAAIGKAKELAGLSGDSHPEVTVLTPHKGFSLMRLLGKSNVPASSQMFSSEHLRQVAGELAMPQLEYKAQLN